MAVQVLFPAGGRFGTVPSQLSVQPFPGEPLQQPCTHTQLLLLLLLHVSAGQGQHKELSSPGFG